MPTQSIGRYKLGRLLGEGQDSAVYLARDTVLDRQAAVKILKQAGGDAYQKVLQEARLASSLDHPFICRVYDVGAPSGEGEGGMPPYIAMEYIEGESLAERLEAGPLDAYTLLRLGTQICEALAYAHDRGVVHGDINATNVLVNEECEAKLVDFGCAAGIKAAGATTVQGDVWALGNLLFQMATGKDALAQMNGREPGELGLREVVSPGLAAIIERCVDTHLSRCYHTAGEVLHDLQAEASGRASTDRALPTPLPSQSDLHNREPEKRVSILARIKGQPRMERAALIVLGGLVVILILILSAAISFHSPFRSTRAPKGGQTQTLSANPSATKRLEQAKKGNPEVKVWANHHSMKYHCPDSPWYGKTIVGQYLTQKTAQEQGYSPAYGTECP